MKARILSGLFLTMLLFSFSGCPPTEPIMDGVWLFTVDGLVIGVDLKANGSAFPSEPPEADTTFVGSMRWTQNRSIFSLTLTNNGIPLAKYTGRVSTSTNIVNGKWENGSGQMAGTWFGDKL